MKSLGKQEVLCEYQNKDGNELMVIWERLTVYQKPDGSLYVKSGKIQIPVFLGSDGKYGCIVRA